jgi:hypothetical protein
MTRNPWGSKPHRFAVEDLLDVYYPVVRSPNSHPPAPAKAGRSVPKLNKEESTATKLRKRSTAARKKGKNSYE